MSFRDYFDNIKNPSPRKLVLAFLTACILPLPYYSCGFSGCHVALAFGFYALISGIATSVSFSFGFELLAQVFIYASIFYLIINIFIKEKRKPLKSGYLFIFILFFVIFPVLAGGIFLFSDIEQHKRAISDESHLGWARISGNPLTCSKMSSYLQDNCITLIAKDSSDEDICGYIILEQHRSSCIRIVAKAKNDIAICGKIPDTYEKNMCYVSFKP